MSMYYEYHLADTAKETDGEKPAQKAISALRKNDFVKLSVRLSPIAPRRTDEQFWVQVTGWQKGGGLGMVYSPSMRYSRTHGINYGENIHFKNENILDIVKFDETGDDLRGGLGIRLPNPNTRRDAINPEPEEVNEDDE